MNNNFLCKKKKNSILLLNFLSIRLVKCIANIFVWHLCWSIDLNFPTLKLCNDCAVHSWEVLHGFFMPSFFFHDDLHWWIVSLKEWRLLELFCSWRYVSDPATACQAAAESTSYNIHNFRTFSMFVFGSLVRSIILISYTFGHSFPVTANQKQTSKYIKQIVQSITLISYIFDHSFPFVHQQVGAHCIMASSNQQVLK